MTREEVLALSAGPDLDARIAEQVMGWRYTIGETSHKGQVIVWPYLDKGGVEFAPSTELVAAWMVVEMLALADHRVAIEDWRGSPNPRTAGWSVLFTMADGHDTGSVVAPSLPLAICRASLLAVATHAPPA